MLKRTVFGIVLPFLLISMIMATFSVGTVKAANACSWPMFRHDPQHTGRSPYLGVQSSILKWSYYIGPASSSPAIGSDGTVYVAPHGKLLAMNPNGTFKWLYDLPVGAAPGQGKETYSSPAIASDGTIYIGSVHETETSRAGKFFAVNSNGTLKWSYYSPEGAVDSSPTVGLDGTVYFTNGFKIYALSPDGARKWSYNWEGLHLSSPAIGQDGTIYVGWDDFGDMTKGGLLALNSNGTFKWSYSTIGYVESSPAIDSDGTIYFCSAGEYNYTSGEFYNARLYALYSDGALKWSYIIGGEAYTCSPAISSDGTIYTGSRDPGGTEGYSNSKLYAINPNGTLKWSYLIGQQISSPTIGLDGTIYFGSNGRIYSLNPDGALKWSHSLGYIFRSEPAISSDGTIYISDSDHLYAFGPPLPALADSFRFPLDGASVVSRRFGKWYDDFQGYHLGEDALRDFEAPVHAPANGVVKFSDGPLAGNYGYVVVIEHRLLDGTFVCSVLGHLRNEDRVSVGSVVTKGQLVGYLSSLPEENGGVINLHYGTRNGSYSTESDRDGKWRYRGYGPADIVDYWYPPSEFINYYNLQKKATLPREVGLTVTINSDKESYVLGEQIRFEATVTNPSNKTGINITAYNAILTITTPTEIEPETPETYYQLGDLDPGEAETVAFNATATIASPNVKIQVEAAGEDRTLGTSFSGGETYTFSISDPQTPQPDWSFAIITDLHIGHENGYDVVNNATMAVERILSEKSNYNIKFVVVLGDLSDHAEEWEFLKAKNILKWGLNDPNKDGNPEDGIPYIPLIGNHDMKSVWEGGADLFRRIFWDENPMNLQLIQERLQNFVRQDYHNYEYQNYFFRYDDVNFACLDLQFRTPLLERNFLGTYQYATESFLEQHLQSHAGEPFIMFSHIPLYAQGGLYDLTDEADIAKDVLASGCRIPTINFAGHTHRNKSDTLVSLLDVPAYQVIETEAISQVPFDFPVESMPTYTKNVIRIVEVKNGEINAYSTTLTNAGYSDALEWPSPFFTHTYASWPQPNKPIVFEAHAATYHGFESSYVWDFGDGSFGSGLTTDHVYLQEGDYNVTLIVTTKNLITDNETMEIVANIVYVRNKHLVSSVPPNLQVVCASTEEDLTTVSKNTYEFARIMKETTDRIPIVRFWINFEQANSDIDLSNLIADVDVTRRKSIISMPYWPAEVDSDKWLFIPSSGTGSIFVCLNVTSLEQVRLENADLIINVGETINNITVTTTCYNGKEYYLVHASVTNFGGGEIFHNVATTNITPSKNVIGQGYDMPINVTIQNTGTFTETSNVTFYMNTTAIAVFTNITLTSGNSAAISFTWNTTGFAYGNYTITAYAWPVPSETDVADNNSTGVAVKVTILGDVDGDFRVTMGDIVDVCDHFGSMIGQPKYDANCDIDGDGRITMGDIIIACDHFGQHHP